MNEAPDYAHNKDRGTFLEIDGVVQPAPGPPVLAVRCPEFRIHPQ